MRELIVISQRSKRVSVQPELVARISTATAAASEKTTKAAQQFLSESEKQIKEQQESTV